MVITNTTTKLATSVITLIPQY